MSFEMPRSQFPLFGVLQEINEEDIGIPKVGDPVKSMKKITLLFKLNDGSLKRLQISPLWSNEPLFVEELTVGDKNTRPEPRYVDDDAARELTEKMIDVFIEARLDFDPTIKREILMENEEYRAMVGEGLDRARLVALGHPNVRPWPKMKDILERAASWRRVADVYREWVAGEEGVTMETVADKVAFEFNKGDI